MAFTVRLFMFLAIAVPTLAQTYKLPILGKTDALPEEYPGEEGHLYVGTISGMHEMDFCPPFGHPDNSYNVTVVGTSEPAIGGCASMVPPKPKTTPSFNLWLGSLKTGGGKCGDKKSVMNNHGRVFFLDAPGGTGKTFLINLLLAQIRSSDMDHYIFQCKVKYAYISEKGTLEGWRVLLIDNKFSGHLDVRCVLYKTVISDGSPIIKMVVSGTHSCSGLAERMEDFQQVVPEGSLHVDDGSMALIFSRDVPLSAMWRKKRSEE